MTSSLTAPQAIPSRRHSNLEPPLDPLAITLRRFLEACLRGDQAGGGVELAAGDVGVAVDGREVGVAEVLGDQARVAELLP